MKHYLKLAKVFFIGVAEFRSDFTTNPGDLIHAYDWGRELAHRATFRLFES